MRLLGFSQKKKINQADFTGVGFLPVKKNIGFTLLEMVIAMGIFIVLFTLTLGIYSYSLKAEQRSMQLAKLQKEAQLIMEVIAKKIRTSRVDYDFYGGTIPDTEEYTEELALRDRNGDLVVFKLKGESIGICGFGACISDDEYSAIPADEVTVTTLKFFISPLISPFSLDEPPTQYPKITIIMNLRLATVRNSRDLLIEQTIPQRLGGF